MAKFLTVAGLTKVVSKTRTLIESAKTEMSALIDKRVEKVEGKELISTSEAEKLAKINVDAAGVISVDNIPDAAFDRCVTVASDEERFALTTEQVQNGDTVRVVPADETQAPIMYIVVDDTKLNVAEGYHEYRSVTDWSTVRNIPEKVVNPTSLDIQINGTSVATYTGMESDTVVANIEMSSIGVEEITDEEIDAMFKDEQVSA